MKFRNLYLFLCLIIIVSCETPVPPKDTIIQTVITDTEGTQLKEAVAGTLLKITAEEFRDFNKNNIFSKGAKIFVDNIQAEIKEAKDNIVLLTLPTLFYTIPRDIQIQLRYNQNIWRLCGGRSCILYLPVVSGTVLAGISGGVSDGTFTKPTEMTLDASGNIYVIDHRTKNDVIIRVTPAGVSTVFAGAAGEFVNLGGIGFDPTRNLFYVSETSTQQVKSFSLSAPSVVTVLAGSGIAGNENGTGTAASFYFAPFTALSTRISENGQGLAVDASGNIFVGEQVGGSPTNSQVRRITPAGVVTTVPGSTIVAMGEDTALVPCGVTVNGSGDVATIVGGEFFGGVVKISGGSFSRIAGKVSREDLQDGTGTAATFSYAKAIDHHGSTYYVADGTNGALRSVSETGTVSTIAGAGHFRTPTWIPRAIPAAPGSYVLTLTVLSNADARELAARAILMDQVAGVAVLNDNTIYVSDYGYRCIWKITTR